ncbi:hypothetical protein MPSI1_002508 [Malassezia psittaci]|uniref:BHLH domain-containing protein n=1 Tax=Malassezia psittaci TaxID=1821823 RepID=A0AAF0JEL5_9BASI|nr:hypothetical protein MPSI1_002508 [Malassezia psittaci]
MQGFHVPDPYNVSQIPTQNANAIGAASNHIDMDLLMNNDLWQQFDSSNPRILPQQDYPHAIPFQRPYQIGNANHVWHNQRNNSVEALNATQHELPAPSGQNPSGREQEGTRNDQQTASSMPPQKQINMHNMRSSHIIAPPQANNLMSMTSSSAPLPHYLEERKHIPIIPSSNEPTSSAMPKNIGSTWNGQTMSVPDELDISGNAKHPSYHYQCSNGNKASSYRSSSFLPPQHHNHKARSKSDDFGDIRRDVLASDTENGDETESAPIAMMSMGEFEAKKIMDKRRRRRESHNAVERRRRDNINSQITELATLLPEPMLLDAITTSTQGGNSALWTFGPETAAKVARSGTGLGSWRAIGNEGDDQVPLNTEGLPPDSCLRMPSFTRFASALAPVDADNSALAAAQAKPNKGIILRKSVEYIRQLQQFLDMQMHRNTMLEAELRDIYTNKAHSRSSIFAPESSGPLAAQTSTQAPSSTINWNELSKSVTNSSTKNLVTSLPNAHDIHVKSEAVE